MTLDAQLLDLQPLANALEKFHPNRFQEQSFSSHGSESLFEDMTLAVQGLQAMMRVLGEDPEREGLLDSPMRIIKAMIEMTSGLDETPANQLLKVFSFEDEYEYDQIILSRDIPFSSLCEHHWLPFTGIAHVAYIPNPLQGKVVGLSKLARVVDIYARRPQVQEKMTAQIASAINKALDPLGVAVIIKGTHTCQCLRGIKKGGSMVTSSLHGSFRSEPETRNELYKLIEM